MTTIFVHDDESVSAARLDAGDTAYDLASLAAHECTGCWTCWWKTPGRCVFKDLDRFYHDYVTADRAVFHARVRKGFVSSRMKSLFDRMIPLFLPYIDCSTGESMHVPRYTRYPDIEFYYEDDFDNAESRAIFEAYIHRVFYQFHSKGIVVKPIHARRDASGAEALASGPAGPGTPEAVAAKPKATLEGMGARA